MTTDQQAGRSAALEALAGLSLPAGWLEGGRCLLDLEGRVAGINDALAAWLGAPPDDWLGQPFWEHLWRRAPEWEEPLRRLLQAAGPLAQTQLVAGQPARFRHYNLELAANPAGALVRLSSVLPPTGELSQAGWNEQLHDEGARREMFVRLLRAEAQLENLIDRWPGVVFTQRADFSFHFASPSIEDLTGVPLAEWRAQPQRFWQLVHEADSEELQQHLKRCVQQKRGLSATFRIRHAKTGRVVYLLEHRQAVVSSSELVLGYEGVWLDITRQVIAEKRLSSAAWKETLAVLTMGLAHDFSNIMAGILSLAESFLAQVDQDHPFREGLALIKQNSLQAHQLVHRIIGLHHGKTGASAYCDLNELVNDLVDLVKKILPRRIQVTTSLAPEALPLFVDVEEFRQVIINLTLNAAEAMPQGGRITLGASLHQKLPELPVMRGALPRLPAVCLAVEDTGCGIKARHLGSIFDPFFTTKPMNKGSGLGLYNTRLFVERHRGAVSVQSTEGAGTTFRIWLPQADFTEAERGLAQVGQRRRSLLLAGRADGPLESTVEFLRCHGYHVLATASEANALDLLESGDYQFAGLMVVLEPGDSAFASLFAQVRKKKLPVKTIAQLAGCQADELDMSVLHQTDILISADMPEAEILDRLNRDLPEPAYEPAPAL